MTDTLILASASPRRRELLGQIGIPVRVLPGSSEEEPKSSTPQEIVQELAEMKCLEAAQTLQSCGDLRSRTFILGADTIVALDGRILGKPSSPEDAAAMLRMLSGRTHQVFTGVCLLRTDVQGEIPEAESDTRKLFWESTEVTFAPLTEEEIRSYVNSGEPLDKAGAYGIQGVFARHVRSICGDYTSVVGLPVAAVYRKLTELDFCME